MYFVFHFLIFVSVFCWIITYSNMTHIHSCLNRGKGSYVQNKHRTYFLLCAKVNREINLVAAIESFNETLKTISNKFVWIWAKDGIKFPIIHYFSAR